MGKIFSVVGVAGIIALAILMFFSQEAPTSVATRFMSALAKGDVEQLVALSYYSGDRENLKSQWEFAVKEAAPHYPFRWRITGEKIAGADVAGVMMQVERGGQGYEDPIDLPLVKRDNKWLVDVRSISRQLYPAMPR